MVDFDEQRCTRLLTAMLDKFFLLCNHACDTFDMKKGLKLQVLNAISESVIDELFIIDFNERKYFTIDVTINGDSLTGIAIQRYYNIDNVIRNKPKLDIDLIEETTPDTDDDMKTIINLANFFRNKSISELKLHTYDNKNMMDSVCLSTTKRPRQQAFDPFDDGYISACMIILFLCRFAHTQRAY